MIFTQLHRHLKVELLQTLTTHAYPIFATLLEMIFFRIYHARLQEITSQFMNSLLCCTDNSKSNRTGVA